MTFPISHVKCLIKKGLRKVKLKTLNVIIAFNESLWIFYAGYYQGRVPQLGCHFLVSVGFIKDSLFLTI